MKSPAIVLEISTSGSRHFGDTLEGETRRSRCARKRKAAFFRDLRYKRHGSLSRATVVAQFAQAGERKRSSSVVVTV